MLYSRFLGPRQFWSALSGWVYERRPQREEIDHGEVEADQKEEALKSGAESPRLGAPGRGDSELGE